MALPKELEDRAYKRIMKNRRAWHDYHVNWTLECGLQLQGTEVKSLRGGKCSIQDAYATFPNKNNDELYLMSFHINPYEQGSYSNHDPKRKRKLLVNHREAVKLRTATQEKGLTLIPLKIYFSGAFVKIEIGVCSAKKNYDKREDTKKKETEREIRRKYKV
jgi:SsrA-binding protein